MAFLSPPHPPVKKLFLQVLQQHLPSFREPMAFYQRPLGAALLRLRVDRPPVLTKLPNIPVPHRTLSYMYPGLLSVYSQEA